MLLNAASNIENPSGQVAEPSKCDRIPPFTDRQVILGIALVNRLTVSLQLLPCLPLRTLQIVVWYQVETELPASKTPAAGPAFDPIAYCQFTLADGTAQNLPQELDVVRDAFPDGVTSDSISCHHVRFVSATVSRISNLLV